MDSHTWLQIVEIIIAVAGFLFGWFEFYRRRKLEQILKTITMTFPGDVAKIEQRCNWGWLNTRDAQKALVNLPDSEEKKKAIIHISDAISDAGAGRDMCANLFNGLLTFQEAQFGTRNITHPHKGNLNLCKEEAKNAGEEASTPS